MGKKKNRNGGMFQWALKAVKTATKASTHVLTIAGVLVASKPVIRGVDSAAHGRVKDAGTEILQDTVGGGSLTDQVRNAAGNVALPLVVGIGLIAGGAYIRKRIGN